MLRIIDNKKIDLTEDEWQLYLDVCKNYDQPPSIQGKDLFCDLFLTDDNGIIVALIPPTRQTSLEVLFFLINIMQHQHLRLIHKQMDDMCKKMEDEMAQLKEVKKQKK